jgi:N-acyl-D-aspartate/D-glutamate deacylase
MLDVVIRNASVIDGTGQPASRGSVGVRDGRIVLDAGTESATRTIDGDGLVLAPGFVDIHTHYDVQLLWDGSAAPSTLHGITSMFGGNCGFTIAPLSKNTADYVMRMMSVVEGMPLASLQRGANWDWQTFEDYLNLLEGRLAINTGILVGHNALRLAVMGKDAIGNKANAAQIAEMARLLEVCLKAGGMGFSSTQKTVHVDHNGEYVPSFHAAPDELCALSEVLSRHHGTSLEFAPEGLARPGFAEKDVALMTEMSRRAGRPVNWNTLRIIPAHPEFAENELKAFDYSTARGGRIVGLCNPKSVRLRASFASGIPLNGLPGWPSTFALPIPERIRALSDPATRQKLRAAEKETLRESHQMMVRWPEYLVAEGATPETRRLEGQRIGDIAKARGHEPFDTLLDIAVADGLQAAFMTPSGDESEAAWRERARVWLDPRTMIGGADSGAHLDAICGCTYTTTLLGTCVRERQLLALEVAVQQLTDRPARLYGVTERGRIADGWHADLVVFDPKTIGPGVERWREDMPGGGGRLFAEATGIKHVFVNGSEVVRDGKPTGATSGRVLRSGRDTDHVNV